MASSGAPRRQSVAELDTNDDIRELVIGMNKSINDKLDSMGNKIEQNSKLIMDLSAQLKDLTIKIREIEKTVQDLKSRTNKQEELSKEKTNKIKNESKGLKKGQDVINDEVIELKRI